MQIEVVSQAAHFATRDADGIGQGARLTYGGRAYTVSRRTDDGAGMTALVLARAAATPAG